MSPDRDALPSGGRMGGAYFLGFFFVALAALLWLRGFGRLLMPLGLVCGVVYGVRRLLRLIRAPVDVDVEDPPSS